MIRFLWGPWEPGNPGAVGCRQTAVLGRVGAGQRRLKDLGLPSLLFPKGSGLGTNELGGAWAGRGERKPGGAGWRWWGSWPGLSQAMAGPPR